MPGLEYLSFEIDLSVVMLAATLCFFAGMLVGLVMAILFELGQKVYLRFKKK